MNRSTVEMQHGTEMVTNAGQSFAEIETAVSGMATQSRDISETVQQLAQIADGLVDAIQNTVSVSNQTAEGAESLSATSQQQLAAMQEVESSSAFLSSLADKLQKLVEQFKVA